MTQPLTREVLLECKILVSEFRNGVRITSRMLHVYDKHPSDIERGLAQIFGDDLKKRKKRVGRGS